LPQVHHFINSGIHSVAEQVLGRLGLFELYQGKIRELPEAYSLTYDKSLSERGDLGARARVIKGCLSGIKREYRYRWGDPAALSAELDALTDAIGDLVSNGIRPVAVARLREVAGQPE
jgi:hypothetical protein